MIKNFGKYVKIKELEYEISIEIKQYFGKQGKIQGNLFLNQIIINLVEFNNYNRIWLTEQELEFL